MSTATDLAADPGTHPGTDPGTEPGALPAGKPATTILTPTGMLGYGFVEQDFWDALDRGVDLIVVDSGSTDPGPYMLGLGATLVTEEAYARDLRPMLRAVHQRRIPLYIGSAGGAGTRAQVDQMVALVDRLAAEEGFSLRVAAIYAEVPAEVVLARLADGRVKPNVRGELPGAGDVTAAAGAGGADGRRAVHRRHRA